MEQDNKKEALKIVTETKYFTKEDALFKDAGGFLTWDGNRVFLHRCFPFEEPWRYISVLDKDKKEIGIITDIAVFDDDMQEILKNELNRKYYMQTIISVDKLKDRYGFTYWDVTTEYGHANFTLSDTHRNIVKIAEDRLMVVDMDGNRYLIPSVVGLDKGSYKRIELYL